jgi:capsular polysaccharide biosynthesis protein
MEYAAAVWRRSVWVGAAGLAVAVLAVGLASLSPVTYRASSSLLVGVTTADSAEGLAYAGLVSDRLLPSVVRLGTSAAVLEPVIEELALDRTPAELADRIGVTLVEDTSVLVVSAEAASGGQAARVANAVARNLAAQATSLHADTEGPALLQVTIVGPAEAPRFQFAPDRRRSAVLGLSVGLLAGVLLSGLHEVARPRIRTEADIAAVASLPTLAVVPREFRDDNRESGRSAGLERLAWLLRSLPTVADGGRLWLLGTAGEAPVRLVSDVRATVGTELRVSAAAELTAADVGGRDAVVVVVRSGRTTRRSLAAALASAGRLGAPVHGVVLDGVVPVGAGWRRQVRAALQGDAPLPRLVRGGRAPEAGSAPWATSSRITAATAVFALGLAQPLPGSTTTALLASVVLLPLWITAIPRSRGLALLTGLAALALVSGLLLAGWSGDGREFSLRAATEIAILLLTGLGAIGLLLWSRGVLPVGMIGVAYGTGLLVHGILDAPQSANAWKFELSLPITIVVLALVGMSRGRLATVLALAALGLANVGSDARSAFGFCVIAAGLVVWQARPAMRGGRSTAWAGVLLFGTAAAGVYLAATELMVAGALGEEVQTRTTTQIAQSGSLLLGGRPEWTATWALMRDQPWGYGLGVVPSGHDVAVAKSGLAVTNIPTVEGYLEHFMLTDRFELHSVAADLWSALGPAGLAYGLALLALLVISLGRLLVHREASGLVCFAGLTAIWNVAFGTLPSNGLDVAFAVGLLLLRSQKRGDLTGLADDGPGQRQPLRSPPPAAGPLPCATPSAAGRP